MIIEYNRFFPSPSGDKGEHVKVICDTFEELVEAMGKVNEAFTYPLDPEDMPFDDRHAPQPVTVARSQEGRAAVATITRVGAVCGNCGGATWDNRQKKAKREGNFGPTSPDFNCKDKDGCNHRMWLKEDGSEGEWKLPKL